MKKKLSIPALWVRMTFWGGLLIPLVMAAGELVLFRLGLKSVLVGNVALFADFADKGWIGILFRAALAALFFWLLFSSSAHHATLGRLSDSELSCALWHALVCLGWFIVLLGAQIGTILIAYSWFRGAVSSTAVSGQSLAIAFYANKTLHSLLPLSDWLSGVMEAALYVTAAFSIAVDSHLQRFGRKLPFASGVAVAILELSIGGYWANERWYAIVVCAVVLLTEALRLSRSAGRGDA